jgi:hypothetical protein
MASSLYRLAGKPHPSIPETNSAIADAALIVDAIQDVQAVDEASQIDLDDIKFAEDTLIETNISISDNNHTSEAAIAEQENVLSDVVNIESLAVESTPIKADAAKTSKTKKKLN